MLPFLVHCLFHFSAVQKSIEFFFEAFQTKKEYVAVEKGLQFIDIQF